MVEVFGGCVWSASSSESAFGGRGELPMARSEDQEGWIEQVSIGWNARRTSLAMHKEFWGLKNAPLL